MKKDKQVMNDKIVKVKTKKISKKKSINGKPKKIQEKIIQDKLENLLINLNPALKLKSVVKRVRKASKALIGDIKKKEKKGEKKFKAKKISPKKGEPAPNVAGN